MTEELENLALDEIGISIGGFRKSFDDYSKNMDRSMGEIQSNTDRLMGETRSMLVDLCLKSGITEINGRRLSREDSHIFFYQKDEMDSAQMRSVREIEEKLDDNMEVNFMPEQLTDSSCDCESSLNSSLNLDNIYAGKLNRNVPCYELERDGENQTVQTSENVTEYNALELFDERSESDRGGNEMLQLLEDVTENHVLQVLDQKPKRNMVEKDGEWGSDEKFIDKYVCCGKKLHKIEECETVLKEEKENFNHALSAKMDFKQEPKVFYVDSMFFLSSPQNLQILGSQLGCTDVFAELYEIEKFNEWKCCGIAPNILILQLLDKVPYRTLSYKCMKGGFTEEYEQMKELCKNKAEGCTISTYRSMLVSEMVEFCVTGIIVKHWVVRKTFDVAWVDEFKTEGIRFIMNNINPTIVSLLKASLEFDERNSFWGEWLELELPPPEPPPRQLVLVYVVSVGSTSKSELHSLDHE